MKAIGFSTGAWSTARPPKELTSNISFALGAVEDKVCMVVVGQGKGVGGWAHREKGKMATKIAQIRSQWKGLWVAMAPVCWHGERQLFAGGESNKTKSNQTKPKKQN